MKPPRRTALVLGGPALALVSLAGLAWWALGGYSSTGGFVRLGVSGFPAATIGFAAAAGTWRGAVRWSLLGVAITAVVFPIILAIWLAGLDGYSTIGVGHSWWHPTGAESTYSTGVPSYSIMYSWSVDPAFIGVAFAITAGLLAIAAAAGFVATRSTSPRVAAVAGLFAISPVAFLAIRDARDGAEVAAMLGLLGVAWLMWALLAARGARVTSP